VAVLPRYDGARLQARVAGSCTFPHSSRGRILPRVEKGLFHYESVTTSLCQRRETRAALLVAAGGGGRSEEEEEEGGGGKRSRKASVSYRSRYLG
jgi:hypothetical protein